jgi:hypothetical protein
MPEMSRRRITMETRLAVPAMKKNLIWIATKELRIAPEVDVRIDSPSSTGSVAVRTAGAEQRKNCHCAGVTARMPESNEHRSVDG